MSNLAIMIFGMFFVFLMSTLGSAVIFIFKKDMSNKVNSLILGFASGIMIAASVWSLIMPAIEQSESYGKLSFIPAVVGILLGALFLVVIDKIVPHFHAGTGEEEGPKNTLSKPMKLFLAVTIHNIPEGLAVGFSFGLASVIGTKAAYISALMLAIGIGIQNFPEGAAISLPMQKSTGNKKKSFLYGMLSGAVEPIFAIIGFLLASKLTFLQPWMLSFAAGAMIFVVVEDLVPDAKLSENPHLGTWGFIIGFIIMMILDLSLG